MPANLYSLDFDILHIIVCGLEIGDYVPFSQTCNKFHKWLQNDSTARSCLQRSIASTGRERHLNLSSGKITPRKAIERIFSSREALRTARPYSVSIIAYGTNFTYKEGVLCYHSNGQIRLLNIHGCSREEEFLDTSRWNRGLAQVHPAQSLSADLHPSISHLSYSNGILACVCEISETGEPWLVVLDWYNSENRTRLRELLHCTTKLFVRQDGSYLYYGTHSALGSHGHHEWYVQGWNLTTGHRITERPLQLVDFFGSELGSTVCFGIHNGSFYAVSNQTSLEVEEVDWTSYYHCIQFALDDDKPNLKPRRLWRRQHDEGPINDSWTELSLQKDEQTDELLIIECRKEYIGGGSTSIRTYYTQPLSLSDNIEIPKNYGYPKNDPLTKTLDDNSRPNYEPAKTRLSRYCHPEYILDRLDPGKVSSQKFILARTNYRAYSPATSSFIDLVNDPVKRPGFTRQCDRIRLRIASRIQKSPLINDPDKQGHFLLRRKQFEENSIPIDRSEEDFHPTEVQDLWPPNDAPTELFDILCPGGRVEQLDAMRDDTTIVYMTGPSPTIPNGERAIVLISFDEMWEHNGLKRLQVDSDDSCVTYRTFKRSSTRAYQQHHNPGQPRTEQARYLSISRGYSLKYPRHAFGESNEAEDAGPK